MPDSQTKSGLWNLIPKFFIPGHPAYMKGNGLDAPIDMENLTPSARQVLALARKEAKSLAHPCIGAEHILLGLIREGEGVAVRVLKSLGVDIGRCRSLVTEVLNPKSGGAGGAAAY